jgi:hypothetical protein
MATTNLTINVGGGERPMTAEELAAYTQTVVDMEREEAARITAAQDAETAKASAKAKLAGLGLTEAEITALLGV